MAENPLTAVAEKTLGSVDEVAEKEKVEENTPPAKKVKKNAKKGRKSAPV